MASIGTLEGVSSRDTTIQQSHMSKEIQLGRHEMMSSMEDNPLLTSDFLARDMVCYC